MEFFSNSSRILVVAAHPDDEVLGCGATVSRFADVGAEIRVLILGEGKTSRDAIRDRDARDHEIEELRNEIVGANSVLGVADIHTRDYPDNRFDEVPLLDIVKDVEQHIVDFDPSIVFTHFADDLNVDHTATNRAVLTATRPLPGSSVSMVAAFEVLSSTGWYYPNGFEPNIFVALSEYSVQKKIDAMNAYQSELRAYPHPRSLESIRNLAALRGSSIGEAYAEGFFLLRQRY